MIAEIKELINHHKNSKDECFSLLEELNQISNTKLSKEDKNLLETSIAKYQEEYSWRGVFISQLESLLS